MEWRARKFRCEDYDASRLDERSDWAAFEFGIAEVDGGSEATGSAAKGAKKRK